MAQYRIGLRFYKGNTPDPIITGRSFTEVRRRNAKGARKAFRDLLDYAEMAFRHDFTEIQVPYCIWKLGRNGKPSRRIRHRV